VSLTRVAGKGRDAVQTLIDSIVFIVLLAAVVWGFYHLWHSER
jgi:hypothetical protein